MSDIPGLDHPCVLGYVDVLAGGAEVGERVAIIGAGGIGFDVAEFLCHDPSERAPSLSLESFAAEWGIDLSLEARGGVEGIEARPSPSPRRITLLQRKTSKPGKGLGKTTGWIHRLGLRAKQVDMVAGANYERIDNEGLHLRVDDQPRLIEVDNVIVCAGQVSNRELADALERAGRAAHVIGGAHVAAELDAKRAIKEACELAARL